jgi:hypothetical protein
VSTDRYDSNTMFEKVARVWDRAHTHGYGHDNDRPEPRPAWGSSMQLTQEEGSIFYYLERIGFWEGFPEPEELYPARLLLG